MKHLIVGLGNVGPEYALTRHNIGFMILDRLAAGHGLTFSTERLAQHAELRHKGRELHLIKPTTYMNLSGKALRHWMTELKVGKGNTLVVVDDLALPFGKLRLRAQGSSAGHNGLKNIEEVLGGQDYPRLKFGIGDNFAKGRQVEYVLGEFTAQEQAELPLFMDEAVDIILSIVLIGLSKTMSGVRA